MITAATPPAAVVDVGREIAERGAAAGYRGIAGFDVAAAADGRVLVLDLNFRVNGSTPGLLYRPAIEELRGPCAIQLRTLRDRRGWASLRTALEGFVESGHVVPLASYDPAADGGDAPARASVLLTGRSREDVDRTLAALRAAGLG